MRFSHVAAGLIVGVNRALPGLPPAQPSSVPDITIAIDERPAWAADCGTFVYATDRVDAAGTALLVVTRAIEGYCLEYSDRTRFWVDSSGGQIWTTWAPDATFEDACTYLVGTVLGLALRLRGDVALHASAVEIGGTAVAIVGPHGAGKSTTVAAFARRGFPVVTDDLLRVTGDDGEHARVHPYGGVVRLWPDSETLVYGGGSNLPPITPSWEKRALAIGGRNVRAAAVPLPIASFICLAPRRQDGRPHVVPMRPADALVRLAANSTAGYLLDRRGRANEFRRLAAIVGSVQVLEAQSGSGAESLNRFVDLLLQWHDKANHDLPIASSMSAACRQPSGC